MAPSWQNAHCSDGTGNACIGVMHQPSAAVLYQHRCGHSAPRYLWPTLLRSVQCSGPSQVRTLVIMHTRSATWNPTRASHGPLCCSQCHQRTAVATAQHLVSNSGPRAFGIRSIGPKGPRSHGGNAPLCPSPWGPCCPPDPLAPLYPGALPLRPRACSRPCAPAATCMSYCYVADRVHVLVRPHAPTTPWS